MHYTRCLAKECCTTACASMRQPRRRPRPRASRRRAPSTRRGWIPAEVARPLRRARRDRRRGRVPRRPARQVHQRPGAAGRRRARRCSRDGSRVSTARPAAHTGKKQRIFPDFGRFSAKIRVENGCEFRQFARCAQMNSLRDRTGNQFDDNREFNSRQQGINSPEQGIQRKIDPLAAMRRLLRAAAEFSHFADATDDASPAFRFCATASSSYIGATRRILRRVGRRSTCTPPFVKPRQGRPGRRTGGEDQGGRDPHHQRRARLQGVLCRLRTGRHLDRDRRLQQFRGGRGIEQTRAGVDRRKPRPPARRARHRRGRPRHRAYASVALRRRGEVLADDIRTSRHAQP